jgi:hypothetical protein
MKAAMKVVWLVLRASRWLTYIALLFLAVHAPLSRESYMDAYGHLTRASEAFIFGLGIWAFLSGFLEMMVREKAGIPRAGSASRT